MTAVDVVLAVWMILKGQNPTEVYHVFPALVRKQHSSGGTYDPALAMDLFHLSLLIILDKTLLLYLCFNTAHVYMNVMCIRAREKQDAATISLHRY